ncbi:rabenosyn 5 [Echinococcus multilocularis]|uniref:Rabenosyn 5 n=1 Tax=Echinococcus multilocularis TaxID=6211 RepID=A0A087VZA0_ECHMU|nr:rabenosyn 5 [Echinococcus multilocularis]
MAEDNSFTYQETIIEGFLCPSCLKPFSGPELLEDHFAKEHFHNTLSHDQFQNYVKAPVTGKIRSLTSDFDKLRQAHVNRTALETNLLLIRLEKLSNIPDNLETSQRHALEQSIVPWIEAKVNLCPRCGASFGLGWSKDSIPEDSTSPITSHSLLVSAPASLSRRARESLHLVSRFVATLIDNDPVYRRMHHCRLCGHIICADCSFFLSKEEISHFNKGGTLKHKPPFFSRATSVTSLDSAVPKRREEIPKLRICEVCKSVLEEKMQQIEDSSATPLGFEEFQMAKVTEKMPLFSSMASSLNSGEEKYILEIAKSLRLELLQSLRKIDEIGKAIASLDVSLSRSAATQARLNRTVGQFARRFVQNNLPSLRVLPSEMEHRRLAQKRTTELESKRQEVVVSSEAGWMPSSMRSGDYFAGDSVTARMAEEEVVGFDESSPRVILMRQMDLVADYLMQAQAAHRSTEEITNLAQNLADLEIELTRISAASPHQ